ncbi:MAG: response regulator [Elusimicrobia bacterium]|nr:response regulator [Candidatus Liberimonas magnetica]
MPRKILIADDEPDILSILGDLLTKAGFNVTLAKDGLETLEKVNKDKPDLIVLDIMMPRLDGHSVNIKLKENKETANIPVIIMTAYGHFKKLLEVRNELTVSAYLEKPFPVSMLLEKIKEILSV